MRISRRLLYNWKRYWFSCRHRAFHASSLHQETLTILSRIDCNKSFIINFLSPSLECNYLCKYIIDSISFEASAMRIVWREKKKPIENENKKKRRAHSRSDHNESIWDILLSKQRPYVFLLLLRRRLSSSDARITLLFPCRCCVCILRLCVERDGKILIYCLFPIAFVLVKRDEKYLISFVRFG